jgi:hypothetical protein
MSPIIVPEIFSGSAIYRDCAKIVGFFLILKKQQQSTNYKKTNLVERIDKNIDLAGNDAQRVLVQ